MGRSIFQGAFTWNQSRNKPQSSISTEASAFNVSRRIEIDRVVW